MEAKGTAFLLIEHPCVKYDCRTSRGEPWKSLKAGMKDLVRILTLTFLTWKTLSIRADIASLTRLWHLFNWSYVSLSLISAKLDASFGGTWNQHRHDSVKMMVADINRLTFNVTAFNSSRDQLQCRLNKNACKKWFDDETHFDVLGNVFRCYEQFHSKSSLTCENPLVVVDAHESIDEGHGNIFMAMSVPSVLLINAKYQKVYCILCHLITTCPTQICYCES